LRQLSDFRGDALSRGGAQAGQATSPITRFVGWWSPLVRHRELTRILPELERMNVFTMVVTSADFRSDLDGALTPTSSGIGRWPSRTSRRAPEARHYERILQTSLDGK